MYGYRYRPQPDGAIEKLQLGLITILAGDSRSNFPRAQRIEEIPNDKGKYRNGQNVKYRNPCQLAHRCLK